ncbi:MAG TPA: imidazole glycerol phosphate synthase subunit HisH [Candidatus Limnocylindrales bacterium]|nr:imidazole glycerol phosphate synthase subunit HisH [Candidatus Limnocylindrales bacterium]
MKVIKLKNLSSKDYERIVKRSAGSNSFNERRAMITVIDYGLGNLASVTNALKKHEIPYEVSSDIEVLKKAKALILPGVGSANQGMENIKAKGIDQVVIEQAKKGIPILGICLGMQLLLSKSEEGNVECLNLIKGKVVQFKTKLKVPQIGWNNVKIKNKESRIMNNISNNSYFYFVNSFYCSPTDRSTVVGATDYAGEFCSMLEKDNIFGVQFHPEKSGDIGLQILRNFWEAIC